MAKYVNKTQPTTISPVEFIKGTTKPAFVADCLELLKIFEKVTGNKPVIWGKVVGYGKYHYISKACEADWFITGFAPRASSIAIYVMGHVEGMDELGKKLGKFKMSGSCIHIKKIEDIDMKVLEQIVQKGAAYMKAKYKTD